MTMLVDTSYSADTLDFSYDVRVNKKAFRDSLNLYATQDLTSRSFQISANSFEIDTVKHIAGGYDREKFYHLIIYPINGPVLFAVYCEAIGVVMIYSGHFYRYLIMRRIEDPDYIIEKNYSWYVEGLFDENFLKMKLR